MDTMFCFQCEQTAGCAGCTSAAGVCGKKAPTARLQDELTGALVGLAVPGVVVDDIGTTAKTMPQFANMWQGMLGA